MLCRHEVSCIRSPIRPLQMLSREVDVPVSDTARQFSGSSGYEGSWSPIHPEPLRNSILPSRAFSSTASGALSMGSSTSCAGGARKQNLFAPKPQGLGFRVPTKATKKEKGRLQGSNRLLEATHGGHHRCQS